MGFGGQFLGNFFSIFYGFLRKNPKTPPKFSRSYQKIQPPTLKNFWICPCKALQASDE